MPSSVNPGTAVCYAPPKDIEWETPESFFRRLDDEFDFTLDVAASEGNSKCERFFTWRDARTVCIRTGRVRSAG